MSLKTILYERKVVHVRLGHMFLILVYASSFAVGITISKDIVYPVNNQARTMQLSDAPNYIAEAIGMNAFFDKLNEGM